MISSVVGLRRPFSMWPFIVAGAVTVVAVLLVVAAPAGAGPEDSPWAATGIGTLGSDYKVVSDGAADSPAHFVYDCGSACDAEYGSFGNWEFTTYAATSGTREIDIDFSGEFDGTNNSYFIFAWVGNMENSVWSFFDSPADTFELVGSTGSFEVAAGEEYGFWIDVSSDYGSLLAGELILEGFDVAATAADSVVPAGQTNSITADFVVTGDDEDQPLGTVVATLPPGVFYVDGSSEVDTDNDGVYNPIADPIISNPPPDYDDELTWSGFTIDGTDGLELRFEVLVADDYAYYYEGYPDADIDVKGVTGTFEVVATASFGVEPPPPPLSVVTLGQAVPLAGGSQTGIVGQLSSPDAAPGEPSTYSGNLTFYHSFECQDGSLVGDGEVEEIEFLGSQYIDETVIGGELFFALALANEFTVSSGYVTATFAQEEGPEGPESPCIAIGPDNDSWTRAAEIPLSPSGEGTASGLIDQPGQSRWYKFQIQPGALATVNLGDLPADYDLAVFKDISQAYTDITDDANNDDLHQLSAEFAPSVFSPSVFSPSVFSPSVFSPDAYAPSVFSPSVFSPSVFSPSVFSPSVFSPSVFSPSVFSPSVFSPSVFSPSVFSPSVFSPSVFSPIDVGGTGYAPSVFSPEAFASAQSRSIIGVSAKQGNGDELVVANTWTNTGDYYIRVVGKNGVFDVSNEFQVDVTLEGATCDLGLISSFPANRGSVGSSAASVILWDSNRIEGSAADVATLGTRLGDLAAATGGVVIDLAGDTELAVLRSQASAQTQCVYATNLVAQSIKNIVDSHRNPNLSYVVLVGGDDSIPFFRYPDQALLGPEADYEPPVADDSASQAALRLNYILGQDQYGASISISAGDGSIPIPELAVGRVVETAAEATGVIDAYLAAPVLNPATSLTTGYDFLTDAAEAVAGSFDAGLGVAGDRLIDPADRSPDDPLTWTADDLRASLFDSGRHDLIYLAGHFSANSALAADYQTSVITTELAASTVDFTNALVFSGGCHSGYNIVNGEIVPGVTLELDWAQAFAQKGATLIAGTGYQYGDTDFVEYSERLYAGFAEHLRYGTGPVAVGEALVDAKQEYLENTPDMRGLHRKSLIISAVFGLPMASVDLPTGRIPAPSEGSIITGTTGFTSGPGGVLGLEFADLNVLGNSTADTVTLKVLPDPLPADPQPSDFIDRIATYYVGPDGVVTNPAEPAIPLVSNNVSVAGQVLRGVGFRGGSYQDTPGITPLTGAPTTELRGVHTPFASEVYFPMRLATVNYFGELSDGGGLTRLNVTPAQHRVNQIGDLDAIVRLYSDLDLRLYYSNNTATIDGATPALSAPPTITGVLAEEVGDDVVFEVFVVGDPAAGVQEVWVTYTDPTAGSPLWQSLDLEQDPTDSTRWTGVLTNGATLGQLDFVAQAVNGVGLTTLDDNYGVYFQIGSAEPTFPDASSLALSAAGAGTFGSDVTVSATLTNDDTASPVSGAPILFSVGGSTRVGITGGDGTATASLPLTSVPGEYEIVAAYAGDADLEPAEGEQAFTINKAATSIEVASPADPVVPGEPTGITATLSGPTGGPLNERTVFFTVTDGLNTQTVPVITTITGVASLGVLDLPVGDYAVTAQFLGDAPYPAGDDETYLASSGTGSVTIEEEETGPDTDGDGIPDDIDDDDDNDGVTDAVEVTIGTDPLVVEVGRQFKQAVRSYLGTLDGNWLEDLRLWRAKRWLDQSLQDRYWVDDDSLKLTGGWFVFNRERKVVKELGKIVATNRGLADDARTAIDVLVFVDRQLAQTQIDDSAAAGGDPAELAEAQQHLADGDNFAADGKWDKAVRQYGFAWDDARDAIR